MELDTLIPLIAAELGGEWTSKNIEEANGYIVGPAYKGNHLLLWFTTCPTLVSRGKVAVYSMAEGTARQHTPRYIPFKPGKIEPVTRIKCSMSRGAEAIARDIKRRLLPDAVVVHRATVDEYEAATKRKANTETFAHHIANSLRTKPTTMNTGDTWRIHTHGLLFEIPNSGSTRVSGYVQRDVIERLVQALADMPDD